MNPIRSYLVDEGETGGIKEPVETLTRIPTLTGIPTFSHCVTEPTTSSWMHRRDAATPELLRGATTAMDWKRLATMIAKLREDCKERSPNPRRACLDPSRPGKQPWPPDKHPQLEMGGKSGSTVNQEAAQRERVSDATLSLAYA